MGLVQNLSWRKYSIFYFIYALILSWTRKSTAEKDVDVKALEQGGVS